MSSSKGGRVFVQDARETAGRRCAEELAEVAVMINGFDAGHRLGTADASIHDSAIGDRGAYRHGIEHAGEIVVGGIFGCAGDFERAVDTRGASHSCGAEG